MSVSVGKKMLALAADGHFGKKDLQKATVDMLDGRGITKTEKQRFVKAFDTILADNSVRVTKGALDAFDHLKRRMSHYSPKARAYGSTLDKGEVKSILSLYVDRTRASSDTSRSSRSSASGGEYGSSRSHASGGEYGSSRSYASGGEYGGSSRPSYSTPSYSSYSGGEY